MLLAGIELIGTSSASGSGSGDGGSSRWRVVEPKASARDFGGDDGVAEDLGAILEGVLDHRVREVEVEEERAARQPLGQGAEHGIHAMRSVVDEDDIVGVSFNVLGERGTRHVECWILMEANKRLRIRLHFCSPFALHGEDRRGYSTVRAVIKIRPAALKGP